MPLILSPQLRKITDELRQGVHYPEYECEIERYFATERPLEEVEEYRNKSRSLKKMRDEVVPVFKHLKKKQFEGQVRFPQNSEAPDCWISSEHGEHGIEVTIAMSKAQAWAGKRLNTSGRSPGTPCLLDSAHSSEFRKWAENKRAMESVEHIFGTVPKGVEQALELKDKSLYAGMTLIIEVPLFRIDSNRWAGRFDHLVKKAKALQFEKVYLVGANETGDPFHLCLK